MGGMPTGVRINCSEKCELAEGGGGGGWGGGDRGENKLLNKSVN